MKTIRSFISLLAFMYSFGLFAQTNIKTMFYNLLNYSTSQVSKDKTPHLKTVLDNVQPDLLMVCELVNESASNYLFNNAVLPYNNQFNKAQFQYSQSPATGLQQMVYYNTAKLILENTQVIPTETRDINHYTFKTNTENAQTVNVFVTHLKASTGSSNRQKRYNSVVDFLNATASLAPDSFVIFSGDFNFYTSNEEGYEAIINQNNPIVMVDPINRPCPTFPNDGVDYFYWENYDETYFWNNASFKDIHTQSTRTSSTSVIDNSGATGGMDDRFDFIMLSENFKTSTDLFYVENSYKAVGNNGNCYNSFVSDATCTGEFSQELRNAVLQVSDHLPVILDLEVRENSLAVNDIENNVKFLSSNIVTNELQLTFKNLDVRNVYIYNQLGQLINNTTVNYQQRVTINTSYLANGLYFLRTDKHQQALKFIKK